MSPPNTKSVSFKEDAELLSLNDFFECIVLEFDPRKKSTTTISNKPTKINLGSDKSDKLGKELNCWFSAWYKY